MEREQIGDYREAVEYLYRVPRFTSKNTMEDTGAFLRLLGSPDRKMQIIHIAGTNGKGSVCAYLCSILQKAGYRVGVFTSPHLVEATERFQIDGRQITKEQFYEAFGKIYDLLDWESLRKGEGYHPTFFEFLFFMAMVIFEKEEPDYCILETGLGGRLDATNAVSQKRLSVITRIGLDHVEYLGNTLPQIAYEKAGILHEGAPAVYLDMGEEVNAVFENRACAIAIPTFQVSKRDYRLLAFHNKMIDFSYASRYYGYIKLSLRTIALYQMENASLAVRALEILDGGRTVTKEQIRQGVAEAFWAGRMEEVLPDAYVDGAHNADGVRAFLESVGSDGCTGDRHLVFGAVQDKDYCQMIEKIADSRLFAKISVVQIQSRRAADVSELAEIFEKAVGRPAQIYESAAQAFVAAVRGRRPGGRVYAAGSLYMVGEIKEALAAGMTGAAIV